MRVSNPLGNIASSTNPEEAAATALGPFRIENCDEVKVVEVGRKTFEMVSKQTPARCVVALDGESLVDFTAG